MPRGIHVGSGTVSGFPSIPPFGIAVTGRQKPEWYFASQQPMKESPTAVHNMANRWAVSEVLRARPAASARNALAYCFDVCSVQNRPISVCWGVRTVLLTAPKVLTWL